jgi:hypothetical protein
LIYPSKPIKFLEHLKVSLAPKEQMNVFDVEVLRMSVFGPESNDAIRK